MRKLFLLLILSFFIVTSISANNTTSFPLKFISRGLPREQSHEGLSGERSAALSPDQARGFIPRAKSNQLNPGKLLSLNFQEIRTSTVLQLIADFSGVNIISSDSVNGNLTLHLENMTWQEALNIILQSRGLGQRQIGNVIIVAPITEIAQHEKQELESEQQLQDLAPLKSILIPIKYGKASDITNLLKGHGTSLLSSRGEVSTDERTNTVWIEETPQRLKILQNLISQLDIPVRQVLIEARIVNIDCEYEDELGVRFGVSNPANNITGSLEGANAMANASPTGDISLNQRLNVDLPAGGNIIGTATSVAGVGGPASMGIALARLGAGTLLDLELSALESEGGAQIISTPRLITADQHEAHIQAGDEIPYQQASSSGATNVQFKAAVLKLNVTPQITPNNKIILSLQVNQDKPGADSVLGVPTINTRQIETQVLADNGETIVLGGIYETNNRNELQRVPFLGSIPIVGSLFRHKEINKKRQELLIFVTPHILSES